MANGWSRDRESDRGRERRGRRHPQSPTTRQEFCLTREGFWFPDQVLQPLRCISQSQSRRTHRGTVAPWHRGNFPINPMLPSSWKLSDPGVRGCSLPYLGIGATERIRGWYQRLATAPLRGMSWQVRPHAWCGHQCVSLDVKLIRLG